MVLTDRFGDWSPRIEHGPGAAEGSCRSRSCSSIAASLLRVFSSRLPLIPVICISLRNPPRKFDPSCLAFPFEHSSNRPKLSRVDIPGSSTNHLKSDSELQFQIRAETRPYSGVKIAKL